jgi:hypothetical protein
MGVPRTRDRRTGDVEHPPLVYLLDASGRIAFQTTASADGVEGLIRRLIEEG